MKVDEPAVMEVRGATCSSGLPKSIEVNANHVCEAVNEPVSMIVDAVRNTLERTRLNCPLILWTVVLL